MSQVQLLSSLEVLSVELWHLTERPSRAMGSTCALCAPSPAVPSWHLALHTPSPVLSLWISVLFLPPLQGLLLMELVGLHVMNPGNPWNLTALHRESAAVQ